MQVSEVLLELQNKEGQTDKRACHHHK